MEVKLLEKKDIEKYSCLFLPQIVEEMKKDDTFLGFILQENNKAIGGMAGFVEEDVFVIASLYVAEGYRREGGARLLLGKVIESLQGLVSTIRIDYIENEGDGLEDFLDVCGFEEVKTDTEIYRISLEEINKSPFFFGESKTNHEILSMAQLSTENLELLNYRAKKENALLPPKGFLQKNLERDISVVKFDKSELQGYLLFEKGKEKELILTSLWVGSKSAAIAAALLKEACKRLKHKHGKEEENQKGELNEKKTEVKDCQIFMEVVNDKAEKLIRGLISHPRKVNRSWIYEMEE